MIRTIFLKIVLIHISGLLIAQVDSQIERIKILYSEIQTNLDKYDKFEFIDVVLAEDVSPNRFSFEGNYEVNSIITNCYKYYENNSLRKIVMTFDAPEGFLTSEYFVYDDELFFVFKTFKNYKRSMNQGGHDPNDFIVEENRYYFNNNRMIKWINENKKDQEKETDNWKKQERLILLDFIVYYSINKKDHNSDLVD